MSAGDLVSGEIKHTATPWHVTPNTCVSVEIRGADRKPVAELWLHEDTKANAEFIVRAVNAHDDLVTSLNDLYTLIHDMGWTTADDRYVSITNAAAALAKAGAK